MSDDAERPNLPSTDDEWLELLGRDRFEVLRRSGTERAFTGELNGEKRPGTFRCAGCGEALFSSEHKYDSGSGWPSFDRPVADRSVSAVPDGSHGMVRTEVRCARCEGHLGHVFDDGPRDTTGTRFCINSLALEFEPEDSVADPGS